MFKEVSKRKERREYLRLNTVFPVAFCLADKDNKIIFDWRQGFTSNISKGGICLAVNDFPYEMAQVIFHEGIKFLLRIEIPFLRHPLEAEAKAAWIEQIDKLQKRCHIGLSYLWVPADLNRRFFHYCIFRKLIVPFSLAMIFFLIIGFVLSAYVNLKLLKTNKGLVKQLVEILQRSSSIRSQIQQLTQEKENLKKQLEENELHLKNLNEERRSLLEAQKKMLLAEEQVRKKNNEFLKLINDLEKEKEALKEQISVLQTKENQITEDLFILDKKKETLEKTNVQKMFDWLKLHQNPRSGLVVSYEGDKELQNISFLYDQALVAIAYIKFSDFSRANKIFDFFRYKAKKVNGGFLNAYYTNDGQPAEYTVHSGPNIWLGIAIAHYINKTKDKTYLGFLREITDWVISLQNQDKEGGIKGGPQTEWYSTEHNLDAYALFKMAYALTGQNKYKEAAEKIINWLILHAYDRPEVPVKRGKGDSTIATDTYAWSIASLGPAKLEELGMNPDNIVEFAEQNCAVEIEYLNPASEKIKIKGFDFAVYQHLARKGVISCEWTAQMILAYKIMAKFYLQKNLPKKSTYYEEKARDYLNDLFKMLISSPSPIGWGESCLPYASEELVDTGHGWVTPKGKTTGSVASTAYGLFAYYGFNPLEF